MAGADTTDSAELPADELALTVKRYGHEARKPRTKQLVGCTPLTGTVAVHVKTGGAIP